MWAWPKCIFNDAWEMNGGIHKIPRFEDLSGVILMKFEI